MPSPLHMLKLWLQRTIAYIDQLPVFTLSAIGLMVLCEGLKLLPWWDIKAWGRLEPDLFGLSTMYRTNTYPFLHQDVWHLLMNLLGVVPMLERFEVAHGTLTSLALFFGALSTLPAVLYVGIEKLLRSNTPVVGASIWGFVLLGAETVRQHRASPFLAIGGQITIPTWTVPFALILITAFLIPSSSILGHLCGLTVGFVFGMGYLNFFAPPEKLLRWIEAKLRLRAWVTRYMSVDQANHGMSGLLPLANLPAVPAVPVVAPGLTGSNQRLGS